jgi:hypothetical protein
MATKTESIENLLEARIHQALRYWHDPARTDGVLTDLLAFAEPTPDAPLDPRTRTNAFLRTALQRLAVDQPVDAELLTARFIERIPADQVALKLKFAESTIFMKQNQAIKRLAKVVAELEADAWRDRRRRVDDRIPVPAAIDPIGHTAHLNHLLNLLHSADAPWIISLEGIGGIGKTTLAAALTRTVAATRTFADFGWVSAKAGILDLGGAIRAVPQPALTVRALVADLLQQLAPGAADSLLATPEQALSFLRSRLKRTPHLIVIDNLETVADLEALAPALLTLANPTRFVLTSRKRMVDESGIYLYPVPELSEGDALALVRQEATLRNLPEVANAPDADPAPDRRHGGRQPAGAAARGRPDARPQPHGCAALPCARRAGCRRRISTPLSIARRGMRWTNVTARCCWRCRSPPCAARRWSSSPPSATCRPPRPPTRYTASTSST